MRRRTLSLIVGVALAFATVSSAHLRTVGGSLLDLLVRGDAVVVVEVTGPTEDPPTARTPARRVQGLGGASVPDDLFIQNAPSPMRYAQGQTAIVVVKRGEDGWTSVQLAGEGIVFDGKEPDSAATDYVADLWKATHDAAPDGDLGLLLRRGLRLNHRKLRLLAALDLAEIAHHRPGLSAPARAAIEKDLDDPALDPAVRVALLRALGRTP